MQWIYFTLKKKKSIQLRNSFSKYSPESVLFWATDVWVALYKLPSIIFADMFLLGENIFAFCSPDEDHDWSHCIDYLNKDHQRIASLVSLSCYIINYRPFCSLHQVISDWISLYIASSIFPSSWIISTIPQTLCFHHDESMFRWWAMLAWLLWDPSGVFVQIRNIITFWETSYFIPILHAGQIYTITDIVMWCAYSSLLAIRPFKSFFK